MNKNAAKRKTEEDAERELMNFKNHALDKINHAEEEKVNLRERGENLINVTSQMFKTTQQRKRINSKKCPNCKKKRKVIIIVLVFVIAVLTIVIVAVVVTNKTDNTEVRNYNTTSIVYNTTENGTSTLG